ncbi:MAG: hypothetical protein B0W54_15120 [Cellvibrio sp. 79]|nr:MAG: hypothetical protein B0W54_15120 [Cellvibrio sp. 79]
MATKTSTRQYCASFLLALVMGAISICAHANPDVSPSPECAASDDYLSKLQRFFGKTKPVQDYSCLTNYPAIAKNIRSYQLIDTRSNPDVAVNDAWNIPVDELKLKGFLGTRPLLLLDEGFSRVQQAATCATLKKAGFTSVKILVGGISQWQNANTKKPKPVTQFVSASDFIHEFFNGRVSVVAATEATSARLKELGFSDHRLLVENKFSKLAEIVISSSGGGYDPVVYIGTPADFQQLEFNQHFSNLYFLQGGVDSLLAQLRRDQLIEYTRTKPQETSFCAKK